RCATRHHLTAIRGQRELRGDIEQALIHPGKHARRLSAIASTPMVTGSWQGNPNSAPTRAQAACASPAGIFEVFSAMPTGRTAGLVRRAAARFASMQATNSGIG